MRKTKTSVPQVLYGPDYHNSFVVDYDNPFWSRTIIVLFGSGLIWFFLYKPNLALN